MRLQPSRATAGVCRGLTPRDSDGAARSGRRDRVALSMRGGGRHGCSGVGRGRGPIGRRWAGVPLRGRHSTGSGGVDLLASLGGIELVVVTWILTVDVETRQQRRPGWAGCGLVQAAVSGRETAAVWRRFGVRYAGWRRGRGMWPTRLAEDRGPWLGQVARNVRPDGVSRSTDRKSVSSPRALRGERWLTGLRRRARRQTRATTTTSIS